MGMGMGAGFGMMMPGMIREAMAAGATPLTPRRRRCRSNQRRRSEPRRPAPPPSPPALRCRASTISISRRPSIRSELVRGVIQAAVTSSKKAATHGKSRCLWARLRKQVVTITFGQHDESGHPVVSFRSTCGAATEQNAQALLRYNSKLVHGAFAFEKVGDREMVTLQGSVFADTLTGPLVSQVLTAIAWQADKVEEKLTGGDQY